jgi:hypothetical protein
MPNAEVIENSYILPHGTRPAHTPRNTTPASSTTNPNQVKDIPIFAERLPVWPSGGVPPADVVNTGDLVNTAVLPTEFISGGATGTSVSRRRPEANEIAKDTIAKVKVTIAAYTAALLAAANCVALTFAPSFRQ